VAVGIPGTRGGSGSGGERHPFHARVERVVKSIPKGRVLSYGQVAMRAGMPGGARAVVRALHQISGAPWWRVIRSDGTVAREMATRQVPRLRAEGVTVRGRRVSARARRT
jgi:methylated-DNA-protein-cysteine methyltransferase-like protein